MSELFGIVLVMYGAVGVAAAGFLYVRLQGPVGDLRARLETLGKNLDKAGTEAVRAGRQIESKGGEGLAFLEGELSSISSSIGGGVEQLRVAKRVARTTGNVFGAIKVPSGMDIKYDSVKIPTIGKIKFPKSVKVEQAEPLRPVEKQFDEMAEQIGGIVDTLSTVEKSIDAVTAELPTGGKAFIEDVANLVKTGGDEMIEAKDAVRSLSESNLLSLAPQAILGYIGVMHLAFLLTGLGFLLDG